jgi:hypothetical protein
MTEETTAILKAIDELSRRVSEIEARGGSGGKRTIWELNTIMEAKNKQAESLKNMHCKVVAMGPQWDSKEHFEEFKKLKKEIRAINEQIASM